MHSQQAVARHVTCRLALVLPVRAGAQTTRLLDAHCTVAHVIFGADGIRLDMNVEEVTPPDGRELLRLHARKDMRE